MAGKSDVTVAQLASARWLTLNNEGVQRGLAAYFNGYGFATPVQSIITDSLTLIEHVAGETDTLTFLPYETVAEKVAGGVLAKIDCPSLGEARVGLFYRKNRVATPAARLLMDRLRMTLGVGSAM